MTFNSGTGITDHIDMLDKMIEIITSRNLTGVAINSGGSATYVIGDILGIDGTGATSTEVAQLEVTAVSAGVITGIRIYRGGAYTVDPTTTTANASTGGGGSGATFDLTMSAETWIENRRTKEAVSATIAGGGTGYNVSDQITLTLGGTGVQGDGSADAVFNVDTVSGGVITGVTVVAGSEGNYEEVMANPVAVTGGTGTGATLTVTYGVPPQSRQDAQVCMLEGEGLAGADEIHVMIKTFTLTSGFDDAYNWALLGATGYNASLPIHQQTGVNGDQINTGSGALPVSDVGAYLVLKNNDADPDIAWWINHNGRRIIMVCKVESGSTTFYYSCHLGFHNQLATDTEYPYPMWICGTTNDKNRLWDDASSLSGGIVEVIGLGSSDPVGPGYLRQPDGNWLTLVSEMSSSASIRNVETEFGIYPFINVAALSGNEQTVSNASDVDWSGGAHDIIPSSGVPGSPGIQLKPTTGSGDDYYWLVAPILLRADNAGAGFPTLFNMYGEIDGVFWFSTGNNAVVSEDRFELTTKRYTIFQNGNRTQVWSYFALDED